MNWPSPSILPSVVVTYALSILIAAIFPQAVPETFRPVRVFHHLRRRLFFFDARAGTPVQRHARGLLGTSGSSTYVAFVTTGSSASPMRYAAGHVVLQALKHWSACHPSLAIQALHTTP